jgi:general secretion pathway protein J
VVFTTLSHQRLYRDSHESDQTEISAWVGPGPDRDRGDVLFLREAERVYDRPDEGGRILPLAFGVRSFDVRFLDQVSNEWKTEWDTRSTDTPNKLPRAVRLGLVLLGRSSEDPDRLEEFPFLTTVTLQYADPLPRSLLSDGGQQQ